jgi:hypothetical protein
MQEADCNRAFASYSGDGTSCDPNPCSEPDQSGACCTEAGCSITTESACEDGNGFFIGEGLGCDPNPCPEPGDLLGVWEITMESLICDTDSVLFSFALTDTICEVDDPYDPGDPGDPEDEVICKYEVDGNELVSTCRSTFEIGGCVTTTISIFRFTFGPSGYTGTGIARSTSAGTCDEHTCSEFTLSAVRVGPPPDPCPTSDREAQMKAIAAGVMKQLQR